MPEIRDWKWTRRSRSLRAKINQAAIEKEETNARNEQGHHSHDGHDHHAHRDPRPYWKRLIMIGGFLVAVFLMLLGIATYVMTIDLAPSRGRRRRTAGTANK